MIAVIACGETSFAGSSSEGSYPIQVSKASDKYEQSLWSYASSSLIQDKLLRLSRTSTGDAKVFLRSASSLPISLLPEQQRQCEQAVQDLVSTAGEPNWDGEGADPVTTEIVEIAQRVVKELPGDIELPQISADPEGNIEFDWYLENGTMFTISVGKEGDFAISGLHQEREERLSAIEKDSQDPLPQLLSYGVQWLRKMKDR